MVDSIDAFPQLAAIADSLRGLYPSLLIFSAGDNRTGNPGHSMNILTSTMLTNYLEKLRVIRCKDQLYLKVIEE